MIESSPSLFDIPHSTFRIVVSPSAAERLARARAFLRAIPAARRVLVVGASRGAADDLVRQLAVEGGATFGVERLSLAQLAARTTIVELAKEGATPSTWLGAEAVAARAVFEARQDRALGYLDPVADTPGFPRALARTVHELRLAAVEPGALGSLPFAGPDLRALLERFEQAFDAAGTADRARVFETAARRLHETTVADALVLLDVPIDHPAEHALIASLVRGTASTLATVPQCDSRVADAFLAMGGSIEAAGESNLRHATSLDRVRHFLFNTTEQPPEHPLDDSIEFFSAPGEGRECVEIARRIHTAARAGVRFDEIAVFVRSPHSYFGLLEHALRRADVPAWFDRGTRRPHPAGRAFLALLACAGERLSALRFAEYLSLGQVPAPDREPADAWAASQDEILGRSSEIREDELEEEERREASGARGASSVGADLQVGPGDGEFAGTLRAPWKWERLLAEASVIGQDLQRWRRRLDGASASFDAQIDEATRQDGEDSPRARGLSQAREQLGHLREFALPVIETLASWPAQATWGEWLDRFEQLAPRVLRMPARVLRVLADLRPMAAVGPIDLGEARRVLADRLLMLESEPPSRRFGRVFVGTPNHARGRSFRIVFVPGLAERLFPQKPREDPLLLDELREKVAAPLPRQHDRLLDERRLLQLAAEAATERLYVSYPRIELSESRPRVPSFYALDIMRAATGRVPDHEALEEQAREGGQATLAWPAPPDPALAIDDQEHDLAVLRRLLDQPAAAVKGHAHYLLKLSDPLRRSVVDRWARADRRWSPSDGLTRIAKGTEAALSAQRLRARPYSASALQKFAACPYQFLLSAIYRLQPLEQPEPLQRLDPLTRGSIFHEVQARFFRSLQAADALPVTSANLSRAQAALDAAILEVGETQHETLAPAVERVWTDEMTSISRDLRAWLEYLARDGEEWTPAFFELSFGNVPGERDPHSQRANVPIGDGFQLRGAIDLIEEHRQTNVLRITDHKTGRRPDRIGEVIVGGGGVLQPVLYGMAVEQALGRRVEVSRLFYCTSAGGFYPHLVPISDRTRQMGVEVLQIIDRSIEQGFLAPAPTQDACGRCDFRPVCGPDEHRRTQRKAQDRLADLGALRSLP